MIITIDGLACSGKGTIARAFAAKYQFTHIDAGLIFRSAAFALNCDACINLLELSRMARERRLMYVWADNRATMTLNGSNITEQLVSPGIAEITSVICSQSDNMNHLTELVRFFVKHEKNVVIDGRNTGSTIFPDAEEKFVLQAPLLIRAKRRYEDIRKTLPTITLKQVEKEMISRDERDRTRPFAPFVVPLGAIILDTSILTQNECVERMADIVFKNTLK